MKFYSHSKVIFIKYYFSILGWSISKKIARYVAQFVLVPFDIGVVYIFKTERSVDFQSFSPLRYWGGLYQIQGTDGKLYCFSPLRYWGGLYQNKLVMRYLSEVLVPFDIGVVYII